MTGRYIATFFSHFGAIRFQRQLRAIGLTGVIKPVPRDLSSSCGTCVEFTGEGLPFPDLHGELEQVVQLSAGSYLPVYRAEDI